jgi:hypothetical protein
MAKFSQKLMGKEVGSAAVYAKPHTMSGGKVSIKSTGYDGGDQAKLADDSVSVGIYRNKDYDGVKTSGIKMRGAGCATKGTMSRGPMA